MIQKLLNVNKKNLLFLMSEQKVIADCSTSKFSQNHLSFMVLTLHSLCQECIRKFPGQHCIKDQHCVEQGN